MAIDPAATSANPAITTMLEEAIAPERPAANANGTVSPSDIPITISRINSPDVKCFSTCGVCGMASIFTADHETIYGKGEGGVILSCRFDFFGQVILSWIVAGIVIVADSGLDSLRVSFEWAACSAQPSKAA